MIQLKRFVPLSFRKPLNRARAVVHRVSIWCKVATRVSGFDSNGRRILLQALLKAPLSIWDDLDEYQMPMLGEACRVVSRGIGVFHIRPFTDDLYAIIPRREVKVERFIRAKLRRGDVFLDAGSNIGYYTVLASSLVGSPGRVIACEMMPETASSLRRNIDLNRCSNVELHEGALASEEGRIVTISFTARKPGSASIIRDSGGNSIEATTKRLDRILKDVASVACMKMDLEGAELGALEGLGSDLEKIVCIVFENQGDPLPILWLKDRGFNVRMLDSTNAIAERSFTCR